MRAQSGFMVIKIKYKGAHIINSPFLVFCPSMRQPIFIANGKPYGLVLNTKSLLVSDVQQGTISEYPILTPGPPPRVMKSGLNGPRAIALDENNGDLYVAEGGTSRLIVFGADWTQKQTLGTLGDGPGQLRAPRSFLLLPDDTVLVCDTDACRLQVLDKQGRFLKMIGTAGKELGQFRYPLGAALSPVNGEIVIADCDNNRLQFLNPSTLETFAELGNPDKGDVTLAKPCCVTYDLLGNLYVCEQGGNCVKVFSPDRRHIITLGPTKGLNEPRGVAIAADGSVCVSDTNNSRIVFF